MVGLPLNVGLSLKAPKATLKRRPASVYHKHFINQSIWKLWLATKASHLRFMMLLRDIFLHNIHVATILWIIKDKIQFYDGKIIFIKSNKMHIFIVPTVIHNPCGNTKIQKHPTYLHLYSQLCFSSSRIWHPLFSTVFLEALPWRHH